MADEILKVTFTADAGPFDKAAQAVQKGAEKTEAAMEGAAATVDTASKKFAGVIAQSADSAVASADKVTKKFGNLFGQGQLPAQATKASEAIQTVAKAADTAAVAATTNAKAHSNWADNVSTVSQKVRDNVSTAFGTMGKAAKSTGDAFTNAAGVIGSAGFLIGNSLANAAQKSQTAQAVHEHAAVAAATAWTAASAAIALAMHRALSEAEQINNLSQVTGVSTDNLQRLKYAVEQTGGSFAGAISAVKSYGETVNEIATNPTAKAAQALNLMGVSLRDSSGAVKDFNTLLLDVSDKFASYQNGAQKAALGQAIFKGSFESVLPLLNRGAAGIKALGDEGEKAGAVWGPDMLHKLEEADAQLKRFTTSITRLGAELAVLLVPLTKAVDGISWLATKLKESWQQANDPIKQTEFAIASVQLEIDRLRNGQVPDWDRLMGRDAQTLLVDAEKRLAALQERLAQLKADAENASKQGPLEITINRTQTNQAPDLNTLKQQKDDLDDFMSRLHGLPVLMGESFALDAKPFEEAMRKVIAAEEAGAIAARDATRMKLTLKKMEQDAILETASVAASTLTAVFGQSKAAAIGSAIINTGVAVTKALSGSVPPWNFIQAGLVAAQGAAQIATIRSTTETGGGGVSSVSAPAAAAPEPQAASQSTLFVQGIDPSSIFTGDGVRGLAERLLQYQRDGGKVVLQ